ncbi:hypothetical protein HID58_079817 [Brassica napus]|uniref:Uncharacterized protein n=1 Tax=Brassica napus TaxID=3708 RepID=A0ABQ7Y350_BRANA|nr:hypothetical protein HID58_079817 [Brassica napus]
MPPRSRLSQKEKGKDIADSPSPTRDASATGSPLDDFYLIYRDALWDTENMTLSQRLLVADAHRLIRDEGTDRVEVGSSDVSGSENRGGDQSDAAAGSERGDADASVRHPNTIAYPEKFFESAQAIAAHSHLRWPDLSREWIRRQQARIARVDWESRLPCVLGPCKSRLPLFTRKQQRLLDKAREMDGVPDLSALLKGKLQLLSKKSTTVDPQGPSNSRGDGASEGGGTSREGASKEGATREGAPIVVDEGVGAETSASGPKKKKKSKKTKVGATDEVPPEESASLDATSEGSKAKRKKDGKKRSRGGAASSVDRDEGLAEGGTPENLSEERRKTSSREGGSGDEPVANERSAPDSSARKSSRPEGSDRVEFSYGETTPLILNPLRCAELTRQIRGGTKEMPQLEDLYFRNEYIDAASSRARETEILRVKFEELEGKLKSDRAAKKELARENTQGGGFEERPENENLEEVPEKDNLEIGDTPVREEETENVGIEDPVLVSDFSSEGREDEEEEDDRAEETSPPQPVEEETTNEVGDRAVPNPRLLLWTPLSMFLLEWKTRLLPLLKTQSVLLLLERRRRMIKILCLDALLMLFFFVLFVFVVLIDLAIVRLDILSFCR